MNEAQLEKMLAEFERRMGTCQTVGDVQSLLFELRRTVGITGRSDSQVPMINGAVLPAPLWSVFGPRAVALIESLQRKSEHFGQRETEAVERKRHGTFEVYFAATVENFETEEDITDPAVFARCHGSTENTYLEASLDLSGLPILKLPVTARLVFDKSKETLEVAIAFAVEREPTAAQAQVLYKRLYLALESGWGANYHFDVPGLHEDMNARFDRKPVGYKFVSP